MEAPNLLILSTAIQHALRHPYVYILLENLILALTTAFTEPSSIIRPSAVVLIAILAYTYLTTSAVQIESIGFRALGGGLAFGTIPAAINILLLSSWSFQLDGPEYYHSAKDGKRVKRTAPHHQGAKRKQVSGKSGWDRFWFMCEVILVQRGADRPWEVKNVPHFSANDPGYVPSRAAFLLRWVFGTFALFLVLDLLGAQPPPPDVKDIFDLKTVPLFGRWGEVTKDQLIVRFMSTMAFWTSTYCMLSILTGTCAIICVALHISEPAAWRPSFGSVTSIYTIRNFWGVWWHQNIRATFEGFSDYIAEGVLHLRKGTITSRYAKIFIPFIVSGFIHYGSDLGSGLSFQEAGASKFFLTEAFGIVLEDAAKGTYRYVAGARGFRGHTPLWQKLIGFLWVVAFQSWATPIWSYPQIRVSDPERDGVLPFTIFGHLLADKT